MIALPPGPEPARTNNVVILADERAQYAQANASFDHPTQKAPALCLQRGGLIDGRTLPSLGLKPMVCRLSWSISEEREAGASMSIRKETGQPVPFPGQEAAAA